MLQFSFTKRDPFLSAMEVHDYRDLNATHVSHKAVIIKPTVANCYRSVYLFLWPIRKILEET